MTLTRKHYVSLLTCAAIIVAVNGYFARTENYTSDRSSDHHQIMPKSSLVTSDMRIIEKISAMPDILTFSIPLNFPSGVSVDADNDVGVIVFYVSPSELNPGLFERESENLSTVKEVKVRNVSYDVELVDLIGKLSDLHLLCVVQSRDATRIVEEFSQVRPDVKAEIIEKETALNWGRWGELGSKKDK